MQGNKASMGGGIYMNASGAAVAKGSALYNNKAAYGGDDLFAFGDNTLSLPDAKSMSGDRKLTGDGKEITGWYYDGYKENGWTTRWTEESRSANLTKTNGYTDVASDAWYNTAVSTMTKAGIVDGYPDGTFGPQRNITRAETATMINRVLDRVPSEESHLLSRGVMQIWPDANPGDWFYLAMQEATNSHDYERNAKWAAADEQWTALEQ